jgi:hypothetical protein
MNLRLSHKKHKVCWIVLTCTLLLTIIGIGVSAAVSTQTYLPIVYKLITPTPTPVPSPTEPTFPPGVQVLPTSYVYVSERMLHVVGEVLNNTSDSLYGVIVSVTFYNTEGISINTDFTVLTPFNLPGWERGCFSIVMDYPTNWSYYVFDLPAPDISVSSPDLNINDDDIHTWYDSVSGDYNIYGSIVNEGSQPSYNVSVGGTLYKASDEPIGCAYFDVDPIDLNPGELGLYDLYFPGSDREYGEPAYYRLRVAGDVP